MEKYDIVILNVGTKKSNIKKILSSYVDTEVLDKTLDLLPIRVIRNKPWDDIQQILKKLNSNGADCIALTCDILEHRNIKIDELFE